MQCNLAAQKVINDSIHVCAHAIYLASCFVVTVMVVKEH